MKTSVRHALIATPVLTIGMAVFGFYMLEPKTPEQPQAPSFSEMDTELPDTPTGDGGRLKSTVEKPKENPKAPNSMANNAALKSVAAQYAQASQHPPYSIPPSAASGLEVQSPAPVTLPLSGGAKLSVEASAHQLEPGDQLEITVSTTGINLTADGQIELGDRSETLDRQGLDSASGSIGVGDEPGNKKVRVSVEVAGETLVHPLSIEVQKPLGEIEGISDVRASSDHLEIDVDLDLEDAGFYELRSAVSLDGNSVAHIFEEASVDSGGSITLKVHGSLLSSIEDPSKGTISNIQLIKKPDRPGDPTWVNQFDGKSITFDPPSLRSIDNSRYESELTRKRQAFLKRLSE